MWPSSTEPGRADWDDPTQDRVRLVRGRTASTKPGHSDQDVAAGWELNNALVRVPQRSLVVPTRTSRMM